MDRVLPAPSGSSPGAPETVATHLVTDVPAVVPDVAVHAVRAALFGRRFATLEYVYVVDQERRFVGQVALADLVAASPTAVVRELLARDPCAIDPDMDQERAAGLAVRHGLSCLPVVGSDGRFLGALPARALLGILQREHVEDLHRLAGIRREGERSLAALEDPPARRAGHRLPWLLVGLAGSLLAAALMGLFNALLALRLEVAFFVPTIVYLADAVGTQTEAIAVRGLSLARTPWKRLLAGELRTGLWIGAVLAALAFPVIWFGVDNRSLALAVSLAIFLACAVACVIGLALPSILGHLGSDPAFGSGPLATIVQDLVSIATYLAIATAVVG